MKIYEVKDGQVRELDGEFYENELEAYKALVASLKDAAKATETKAAEARGRGWKQPFRHACTLYLADGSHLPFPTLRKAFEWAVGGRSLTPTEEKVYAHATHCYAAGCEGAIRTQFVALKNIVKSYRDEPRLCKLERMGCDGNIYTAEGGK